MFSANRLARHASRSHLPRRAVRLRLTVLYGALFLLSGAGLLAITNLLVHQSGGAALYRISRGNGHHAQESIQVVVGGRSATLGGPPTAAVATHVTGPPPAAGAGGSAQGAARSAAAPTVGARSGSGSVGVQGGQVTGGPVAVYSPKPHSAVTGVRKMVPVTGGPVADPSPKQLQAQARQLTTLATRQHTYELHSLLIVSGVALGIMAVISIALGWLIGGRVLRPLEAAFEAQRRFVANASHELRTPLAMMRTSLDVAVAKPAPLPPQVGVLEHKLREGLDQADRLLESFLTLARAQHGAFADETTVSLAALLSTAVESRREAIAAQGIDVRRALDEARVTGSETLLARMVENVVENAVRHNERGGWMRVATAREGTRARVVVESGGPRLDERAVRELAQPFRRLGAERTGSQNGVGLGLSIVAAIAAAHGGTLRLHALPAGGLRVQIELPHAISGAVAVGAPA